MDPLGKVLQPNLVHPPPSPGLFNPRGDRMLYPKPGPSTHHDPSQVWGLWKGAQLPSPCPPSGVSVWHL